MLLWSIIIVPSSIQFNIVGNRGVSALKKTNCNVCTIQLIPYFQYNRLHTVSFSFIVLWVQSNIIGNSNVRDFYYKYNLRIIWLIPYFWSFIVLSIQSNIVGNSKVGAVAFSDGMPFSYDSTYCIFSMHSPSYFINIIHCSVASIKHRR